MMNGRKKPSSTSIMFQSYLALSSNPVDQQVKAISELLNDHQLWNGHNEGAILQNLHFVKYILNTLEQLGSLPNSCFNQTNVDKILHRPENFGAEKSLRLILGKTEESLTSSPSSSSSDTEEKEEVRRYRP